MTNYQMLSIFWNFDSTQKKNEIEKKSVNKICTIEISNEEKDLAKNDQIYHQCFFQKKKKKDWLQS